MTKTTEAQKRATAKWQKANVTQKNVKFYRGHAAELSWLESQDAQNSYIIGLISDDMARHYGVDTWESVDTGFGQEHHCGDAWLTYGEFGSDTYGLHTTTDGEDTVWNIRAESIAEAKREASRFLARLAHGWRPNQV